jgi:hypothetical protein
MTEDIIQGIIDYNLKPLAVSFNINITDLIDLLHEFHIKKEGNIVKNDTPVKKKRGRPVGSKTVNKTHSEDKSIERLTIKRPRGRPPGKKNRNEDVEMNGFDEND